MTEKVERRREGVGEALVTEEARGAAGVRAEGASGEGFHRLDPEVAEKAKRRRLRAQHKLVPRGQVLP